MNLFLVSRRFVLLFSVAGLLGLASCDRTPVASEAGDWNVANLQLDAAFLDVWGSSSDDVFAVGSGGTIIHYDGTRWSTMASGVTTDLSAVWGRSSQDVFAVGKAGQVLHFDGTSWAPLSNSALQEVYDVWTAPGQALYVSSQTGIWIHHGNVWENMAGGPPGRNLFGFAGRIHPSIPKEQLQLVVAWGARIYLWSEGGWSDGDQFVDVGVADLWGLSCGELFAVGGAGRIYHGTAGGVILDKPVQANLYAVHGQSAQSVYAVGSRGSILHFDGKKWTELPSPVSRMLYSVWTASDGEVFVVGYQGTILHYKP